MPKQITTSKGWLLSTTGEVSLSLEQPLDIIVDSTGTGKVQVVGNLLLTNSNEETGTEFDVDFDTLPGIPFTVIGTQGTVKITD